VDAWFYENRSVRGALSALAFVCWLAVLAGVALYYTDNLDALLAAAPLLAPGLALYAVAKASVIGKRGFFTFGSARMSRGYTACYLLGCALMLAGFLLSIPLRCWEL